MAEDKKGFVLYADLIHTIKKMPKEKVGELFITILEYVNDENPIINDMMVELVFEPIKQQLKRDLKKYEARAERSRINGNKGGRPKKPNEEVNNLDNPVGLKKPDTVIDIVTVTVKDTVKDIDSVIIDKSIIEENNFPHTSFKKTLSIRKDEFQSKLISLVGSESEKLNFLEYWTQENDHGFMRFEKDEFWHLGKKWGNWLKNVKTENNGNRKNNKGESRLHHESEETEYSDTF